MAKAVGFKIEIEGQKELVTTTKLLNQFNQELLLTNQALIEINKNSKKALGGLGKAFDNTGDSVEKFGKMVKTSFQTFEKGNKIVQDLGNGYFEVSKRVEETATELRQLDKVVESDSKSIKELVERNKELKKTLETADINDTTEELQKLKIEYSENAATIRDFRKSLKNASKENNIQKGSVEDLRKRAKDLKAEYEGLSGAQRKFSLQGVRLRKNLLALNKQIKSINDSTRASTGFTKKLRQEFTKLFVGRSIVAAAGNAVRSLVGGLQEIVAQGDGTNEVFEKLEQSGNRLTTTAQSIGTSFLNSFGGGISQLIDNVAFSVNVVGNAFISASEGSGIFASILRGIGSIFTDFPAIIGGVIEVFAEFRDRAVNLATEVGLQFEKLGANLSKVKSFITGDDTEAINRRIEEINRSLEENVVAARSISQAYNEGFAGAKEAQRLFNEETDKQIEQNEKIAAQETAREKRRKEQAAAEKKRLQELERAREKIIQDIRTESEARLIIIKELGAELTAAEIENIEDRTEQLIAAENERFRLETEARKANFDATKAEVQRQREELDRLFEEDAQERIDFEKQVAAQLLQIQESNNAISEQKEKEHQENLKKIREEGAIDLIQLQTIDVFEEQEKARDEFFKNDLLARQQQLQRQEELEKKAQETRKERLQQALDTSQQIADTAFNAISQFTEIANAAETSRLDTAIANREASINNLNEQLANATGLQKKFLEQQVANEQKALQEEQQAREAAEKQRVKQAQELALIQAIINGAIAITRAFSDLGPIAGAIAAVGVAAGIAAQIATISSQKFAEGGLIGANAPENLGSGKITSKQNIRTQTNGDNVLATVKRGEVILNARQQALLGGSRTFRSIGVPGFQGGGIIGAPISAPAITSISDTTANESKKVIEALDRKSDAINARIDRLEVVQDLNNLNDIQKNDATLETLTTL